MPRRKSPEDLSADELRQLLIEKQRSARRERIEHFKNTGRVVSIAPDVASAPFDKSSPTPVVDTPEENAGIESILRGRHRITDRILLGVEILAVVGLVAYC